MRKDKGANQEVNMLVKVVLPSGKPYFFAAGDVQDAFVQETPGGDRLSINFRADGMPRPFAVFHDAGDVAAMIDALDAVSITSAQLRAIEEFGACSAPSR